MTLMTDGELLNLIELRKKKLEGSPALELPGGGGGPDPWDDIRYPGDDTFDDWQNSPAMKTVYFYYFGPGANQTMRTVIYEQREPPPASIPPSDATLLTWIADAQGKPAPGVNFDFKYTDTDAVGWHGPGYLIFFVDYPGWSYLHDQGKNKSLHFAEINRSGRTKKHPNYSFYSSATRFLMVDGQQRELLVLKNNHFKAPGPGGQPKHTPRLDGETEDDEYKFDIYLGIALEQGGGKKQWFILDPGGKNVGPP